MRVFIVLVQSVRTRSVILSFFGLIAVDGVLPGTEPSSDQCIFLNYYKVKYRLRFFPKVIKANADPPSPRGTPDDATGGPVLAADNPEIEQETDDSEQTSVRLCLHQSTFLLLKLPNTAIQPPG